MKKARRKFWRCLRQLERSIPNRARARRLSRLACRYGDRYWELHRQRFMSEHAEPKQLSILFI